MARYPIRLTTEEKTRIKTRLRDKNAQAVLLLAALRLMDSSQEHTASITATAQALGLPLRRLEQLRKTFASSRLTTLINPPVRTRRRRTPSYGSAFLAQLQALLNEPPPEGHARWSCRLLAQALAQRGYPGLSAMTVQRYWRLMQTNPE